MAHDSHVPPDWALVERYLLGECSPAEARQIEQALAAQPEAGAAAIASAARDASLESYAQAVDLDLLKRTIDTRIAAEEQGRDGLPDGLSDRLPRIRAMRASRATGRWARGSWRVAGIAAVAVAMIGGAVALGRRGHATSATPLRYATTTGQLATVVLADSSRVVLAPNSTLIVPADFGQGTRTLDLSGEAHFEVIPDRRSPLAVRIGAVTTRVLGTTFDIRHYPGDAVGRVTVFSGKVATGARNASMTLTAGMVGKFTDSAVTGTSANDSTMYTDWSRGRIVFHNAPVPVVLATLRQWYGYEFRLADSTLATQHVSAVFLAGETNEMLAVVSHMLGVSMTRQDSVIILRPDSNASSHARVDRSRRHSPFSTPTEVGR